MSKVIIGRIASVYGLKGWNKIISFTEPRNKIFEYTSWQIHLNGEWKETTPSSHKPHGKGLLVKLAGSESCEDAGRYVGTEIAIERDQFPTLEKNEYYWADLEGLSVVNEEGLTLGTVKRLMETGSNDVLVVEGEKSYAIPYIRNDFVLNVDIQNKVINVAWDADFCA